MASPSFHPSRTEMNDTQLQRLRAILNRPMRLAARSHVASNLQFRLPFFIPELVQALAKVDVMVEDVRLEGSAATSCFAKEEHGFNDLDIVFHLKPDGSYSDLTAVRAVLINYLRNKVQGLAEMDEHSIAQSYFAKMFITPRHTQSSDAWALFTINGIMEPHFGTGMTMLPALDLKFVQRVHQPYQFSINSLQIALPDFEALDKDVWLEDMSNVHVHCAYGELDDVLTHIDDRVIAVRSDASVLDIHGGGLLKYAALCSQGYTLSEHLNRSRLEHFMLQRFLKDFISTPNMQWQRILDYLQTHMRLDGRAQYNFVHELSDIVDRLSKAHAASQQLLDHMKHLRGMAATLVWSCRDYWLRPLSRQGGELGSAPTDRLDSGDTLLKVGNDSAASSLCSSPPSSVRGQQDGMDRDSGATPSHYDSGAVSDASNHTDDEILGTSPSFSPRLGACQPSNKALLDPDMTLKRLSEITNSCLLSTPIAPSGR
eukprot:m.193660 g.193660  ORF g.193660 m.193660 type:complete len:485 (-) comp16982_c0_seq4:1762-3216(-)